MKRYFIAGQIQTGHKEYEEVFYRWADPEVQWGCSNPRFGAAICNFSWGYLARKL
jgi:hypothetical protein